ncbi:hypothetical protein [Arthrobacter sp. HLT1-21]
MTTFDEVKHPRAGSGQFKETAHAESPVTLTAPARALESDPNIVFGEHRRMVSDRVHQISVIQSDLDSIHLRGARMAARNVSPGATELRLKYRPEGRYGGAFVPSRIKDASGEFVDNPTDYTQPSWAYKSPAPEVGAATISHSISDIKDQHRLFEKDSSCEYDPSNDEWVIYLAGQTSSEHQNG